MFDLLPWNLSQEVQMWVGNGVFKVWNPSLSSVGGGFYSWTELFSSYQGAADAWGQRLCIFEGQSNSCGSLEECLPEVKLEDAGWADWESCLFGEACSRSGCRLRQSVRKLFGVYRIYFYASRQVDVSKWLWKWKVEKRFSWKAAFINLQAVMIYVVQSVVTYKLLNLDVTVDWRIAEFLLLFTAHFY